MQTTMEDNKTSFSEATKERKSDNKLPVTSPSSAIASPSTTTSRGKTTSSITSQHVMSSPTYWLSQVKQSEAAAKHQLSLGFFKLALEAGCENVERLRKELESYASRHNLLDDPGVSAKRVKKLFRSYNISEIQILSAPEIKMAEYLPFEIQTEIMKRLPIKSLIQFRSVSKQWKSLINSFEFIAEFNLLRHTQSKQHLLVSYRDPPEKNFVQKYVSIVDDDNAFPQLKFPLTSPMPLNYTRIVGSSQGLFCICKCEYVSSTVVLWNPSIQKSVSIDMLNVLGWPYKTVIGFLVCPDTSDPKLVKITYYDFQRSDIPWQVEIFTLSSGVWRTLYSNNLPRKSIFFETPVDFGLGGLAIDQCIYWLAYDDATLEHCHRLIMSFDMIDEEFTEICLPESLAHKEDIDLSIFKLRESLVVLECNYKVGKHVYGVWMMEHGVPNSFTTLYTINPPDASVREVLGFKKSGEPIIAVKKYSEHEALFVYEPCSQHLTYIGISGSRFSFFVSSYMETLLLLDH